MILTMILALIGGSGADFADLSRWEVLNYENRLTIRQKADEIAIFGPTGKCDTAWSITSPAAAVPADAKSYVVRYETSIDRTLFGDKKPKDSWSCRVRWLKADGSELSVAPFAAFLPEGDGSAIAAVGPVPTGAAKVKFVFGCDWPDLPVGQRIAFRKLALELTPRIVRGTTAKLLRRGSRQAVFGYPKGFDPTAEAFPPNRTNGLQRATLRDDGIILLDGKPYFPVGIYSVCKREFNGQSFDKAFRDLAKAGFNFAHTYGNAFEPGFFEAARKYGFKLWVVMRGPSRHFLDTARFEPSILAWYLGDDTATWWTPKQIFEHNAACHAADPFRLTCQADCLSAAMPFSRYADYVGGTDIFMPEIYPIRFGAPDLPADHDCEKLCVADTIRDMQTYVRVKAENGDGKPHCCIPIMQAFKGWTLWKKWPTREQLFATTFAALVHGAQGITWYTYGGFYNAKRDAFDEGITSTAERWQLMTELVGRIRELEGPLTARACPQPAVDHLAGPKLDGFGHPSVTCLLRRHDGKAYLIAVNGTTEEVRVRFNLASVGASATVLHENRTCRVDGGRFTDTFAPFGVHVYVMEDL